jgi:RNA polymerase sigma factor (TIGR02999 family)
MAPEAPGDVTRLLAVSGEGDRGAAAQLIELLRGELQGLARQLMRSEAPGHTLQATALVNELYLRFSAEKGFAAASRPHFLAIAARAMRQILARHAKDRRALKRGGAFDRVSFSEDPAALAAEDHSLGLDAALEKLAALSVRQARVVEMRFFADLTLDEIAEELSLSTATVERDWRMARAWMRAEMSRATPRDG